IPLIPELEGKLDKGIHVIDAGCGSGRAMLHLAKRFPRSRFVGVDLSDEAIASASARAAEQGLTNVRFEDRDIANWDASAEFDLVTAFDSIHDQAHPDRVLANIARALRPGG